MNDLDINVNGEIICSDDKWLYNWYDYESFCPKDLEKELKNADGEEVNLFIDSPGGNVEAASRMRSMLKAYKGKSISIITGFAASAASVLMTGTDVVKAYVTANIMIHQAACRTTGNSNELAGVIDMLTEIDRSIANAYAEKTGKAVNEVLKLMEKTSWYSVQKAKEEGFIDEIISDSQQFSFTNHFGTTITNKMREIAGKSREKDLKSQIITTDEIVNKVIEALDNREKQKMELLKNDILKDLDSFGKQR